MKGPPKSRLPVMFRILGERRFLCKATPRHATGCSRNSYPHSTAAVDEGAESDAALHFAATA
ncbi:hypothetical protein PLANPX_0949 [Lacipirellula parvula]|uniref:Uncharacterized protein n=1 Tax=Lacipirellula parvula TaxID=2650471 RepID=A0A5K7X666_9BACT|nr:hypothetical protein PLANPX_0949 [Lacipirellula parvula]